MSPEALFIAQLCVIGRALTKNCLVMGDFNLDVNMEHRPDYCAKIPLNHLTAFTNDNNLTQIVDFNTWSRTINGIRKESLIDHVYTDNITLIRSLTSKTPTFGDHLLLITELELMNKVEPKPIW